MTVDPSKVVLVIGEKPPGCAPGQHRNTSEPLILCSNHDTLTITLRTGPVKTVDTTAVINELFYFPAEMAEPSEPSVPWPPKRPAREMAYLQLRHKRGRRY